jgi:metal-responsive CopG/Arc/MetJ family transcriptional regulator
VERTNIHLTDDELKDLGEISKSSELSRAELVRRAVDEFIENYKVFGLTIKGITGLQQRQ